jgi:hypothetical protein
MAMAAPTNAATANGSTSHGRDWKMRKGLPARIKATTYGFNLCG